MVKKAYKKHNFKHLEKALVGRKAGDSTVNVDKDTVGGFGSLVPLGSLINKDLKNSGILIALIILTFLVLGVVVYKTELLAPLLLNFQIKY